MLQDQRGAEEGVQDKRVSQDDTCLGRNEELTWKKVLSEHCLHRDSDRGLFWQYFSYI